MAGPRLVRLAGTIFSHQVEGDYRVTFREIVATRQGLEKLKRDLSEVLKLCVLANLQDKRIAPDTWETVRAAVPAMPAEVTPEVSRQFLSLLSQPGRLGNLLRRLHELGVLEKIMPAFTHARSLLQFNEYHRYTVDEHCILAVERATDFVHDQGIMGSVYRGIKQKRHPAPGPVDSRPRQGLRRRPQRGRAAHRQGNSPAVAALGARNRDA